jgi:hypothetical protein
MAYQEGAHSRRTDPPPVIGAMSALGLSRKMRQLIAGIEADSSGIGCSHRPHGATMRAAGEPIAGGPFCVLQLATASPACPWEPSRSTHLCRSAGPAPDRRDGLSPPALGLAAPPASIPPIPGGACPACGGYCDPQGLGNRAAYPYLPHDWLAQIAGPALLNTRNLQP